MIRKIIALFRRRTKLNFVESTFRQLVTSFPNAQKHQGFKTDAIPGLSVDILAKSSEGRYILFILKHFLPNTSINYSAYPSVAAIRDAVKASGETPPPILIVITNTPADEPVENFFGAAGIPLIALASNEPETKNRLERILEQLGITLPELRPNGNLGVSRAPEFLQENDGDRWKISRYTDKLNLNLFVKVVLVILLILHLTVKNEFWLIESFVLAIATTAYLFLSTIEKKSRFINPDLLIESEERNLTVRRDEWYLERRICLKALRKVEVLRLSVDWTGSSKNIKITCGPHDGILKHKNFVESRALDWNLWELYFEQPMHRWESREIVLKYTLPDPKHTAKPYHFIAFNLPCKDFRCRLSLADDIKTRAVYFVRGATPFVTVKKREIPLDPVSHEYIVQEKPNPRVKYSLEWEEIANGSSNGTSNNTSEKKNGSHTTGDVY